mmetsp:Transcript_44394/g.127090  ORF Transcript_44394/g.127090 Transcript_44394/m.127090 type:complete len:249 (-) Transcript_44394:2020-2766(-)
MSMTLRTSSLNSGRINSSTKGFPSASSLRKPVIVAVFWFHCVILPCVLTPKIGAFAVSIRRSKSPAADSTSFTASRNLVMSCPTITTPVTLPLASKRAVAFNNMSTRLPSLVINGTSKFAVSTPLQAWVRTSRTLGTYSGVMNSLTKWWPRTSSRENPVSLTAFVFHSVTLPSTSTPMIGAFALSISRCKSSAMVRCSARLRSKSVMSCPTPITPLTSPVVPRRAVAFRDISRLLPSLVWSGKVKFAV